MNSSYILVFMIMTVGLILIKRRKANSTEPVKNDVHDEPLPVLKVKTNLNNEVYWYEGDLKRKGFMFIKNGLQIFDENGELVLDLTTHLTKILGTADIPKTNGRLTDARIAGGTLWYTVARLDDYKACYGMNAYDKETFLPKITQEGNDIVWSYKDGESGKFRTGLTLIYGVF